MWKMNRKRIKVDDFWIIFYSICDSVLFIYAKLLWQFSLTSSFSCLLFFHRNEFVYLFAGRMDVLNCYGDGFVMIAFGSIKSEEVLLMEFFLAFPSEIWDIFFSGIWCFLSGNFWWFVRRYCKNFFGWKDEGILRSRREWFDLRNNWGENCFAGVY